MIIELVRSIVDNVAYANDRRRAIRTLEALNDHMLLDMGIERFQIPDVVDNTLRVQRDAAKRANRDAKAGLVRPACRRAPARSPRLSPVS